MHTYLHTYVPTDKQLLSYAWNKRACLARFILHSSSSILGNGSKVLFSVKRCIFLVQLTNGKLCFIVTAIIGPEIERTRGLN